MKRTNYIFILIILLAAPASAAAQVAEVVFTTSPQSIGTGAPSAALTLAVQDASGNSVSGGIPQTGCIALTSSSQTGQFSSSATNWNPVSVLTMNKSTSNRSFFYQDVAAGTYTLDAAFALKPTTVSDSCASWPQSQWGTVLHASQNIAVGTADTGSTSSDRTNSSVQTTTPTPATTQQTVSAPTPSAGPETLTVKITSQPVIVVGAGSFFTGSASDSRGLKGSSTRYIWNFDDGSTQEGQTVFHTYTYPGTYVVLMTAASGDQTGIGRTNVQVVPAQIGMILEPDGSVVLSNQSSQELNIGLWNISSGTSSFPIPEDTILLGGKSIHFSSALMHMTAGEDVTLRYPNNTVVAVVGPSQKQTSSIAANSGGSNPAEVREFSAKNSLSSRAVALKSPPQDSSAYASSSVATTAIPLSALAAAAEAPVWSLKNLLLFLPYALGALGLILVGIGLFFKKNPMKQVTNSTLEEFDISD